MKGEKPATPSFKMIKIKPKAIDLPDCYKVEINKSKNCRKPMMTLNALKLHLVVKFLYGDSVYEFDELGKSTSFKNDNPDVVEK